MPPRILFVGWDGADWEVLDPLIHSGLMPHLAELIDAGKRGPLQSTFPPHSVAAWTSFFTGTPASEHGLTDFFTARPGRYMRDKPLSARDVPRPHLFDCLAEAGVRVLSANMPMTYPPFDVNGLLIGGVFAPKGAELVAPTSRAREVAALGGFPDNGMAWTQAEDLSTFCREATSVTETQTDVFIHLLRRADCDVAFLALMAPDRLQHVAMHLLEDRPSWADCDLEAIAGVYEALDKSLGRLRAEAGPGCRTVLMSDHGFRRLKRMCDPNQILRDCGFLTSSDKRSRMRRILRPLRRLVPDGRFQASARARLGIEGTIDWTRTLAYCPSLSSQVIRLNLRGREPRGIVPHSDAKALVDRMVADLSVYVDEQGAPVFDWVRPASDGGPDPSSDSDEILFQPAEDVGVTIEGSFAVSSAGSKTGDHRQTGIVVTDLEINSLPTHVWDVPGLILQELGVSGEWPPQYQTSRPGGPTSETDLEEISVHLRNLGYIE